VWYKTSSPSYGLGPHCQPGETCTVRLVYSSEQIRETTERLARAINRDYAGESVHFVGVLKGSFVFLADLIRHIRLRCSVDFVRLSSYGSGTRSSGVVEEALSSRDPVAGRHVIVVEEIVDTGATLERLLRVLALQRPASLKVCALVDKTGRREVEVPVDYSGFTLETGFLVGYGLDLGEDYRNLPAIYAIEDPL
jgi:hypoxanthine phosphoribosyltransferase